MQSMLPLKPEDMELRWKLTKGREALMYAQEPLRMKKRRLTGLKPFKTPGMYLHISEKNVSVKNIRKQLMGIILVLVEIIVFAVAFINKTKQTVAEKACNLPVGIF